MSLSNFFWQYSFQSCSKFATGLRCSNKHTSKSIWVTCLFFCQNDSPMSESFWQKNRQVTHILLLDLCLFEHFSPVANFGHKSRCTGELHRIVCTYGKNTLQTQFAKYKENVVFWKTQILEIPFQFLIFSIRLVRLYF